MHLDGAAEAAVDFALTYDIPFAIVPCCTCSKDFPCRFYFDETSGKHKLVKSYDELVNYLVAKDPEERIFKSELDFQGKNLVLWRR